ncbi:hypothetical protein HCN44_004188 [Aphidius gifuensis]|uniref:HMG box domain-containing protein n=1 Tax=Aphidius gifuensis TaxID=684658 RepID=A0A834XYQ9_APHGI|nr:HMG box-containing protein 4-like [Aphidius gifuensis]XP_044002448.1 HMG box-containing protein 4-like [Aphidius gifuensis]XP_044002450.1 HMG box-containing protein 4-like [Aphidius gifuensis]KAF7994716.1 hypothetical protein HCN44_004188 [Aphidius gifuensis]
MDLLTSPKRPKKLDKMVGIGRKNKFKNQEDVNFKQESSTDPEQSMSETEFDGIQDQDDEMIGANENYFMETIKQEEIDPLFIDKSDIEVSNSYLSSSSSFDDVNIEQSHNEKARVTAYTLWAKNIRKELTEKCPYMDFTAISKRLGALWATVPNTEKHKWRKRAKHLADIYRNNNQTLIKKTSMRKRKTKNSMESPMAFGISSSTNDNNSSSNNKISKKLINDPVIGTGTYKVIGTEPVDVAAYLKLLGESLMIIGKRLKEHEGQIAVSGSVSVLLDSLLCALGPLMCLTKQIPETATSISQNTLTNMLDNISYIMPGL